jgi:hypothetical protein
MNELYRRFREHKFEHDKGCKFEKQVADFDFDGVKITLRDDDHVEVASLNIKYCPYCGYDIDASAAQMLIIKQRTKELIEASPIKKGDVIWIRKPNNDYWNGRGFRSIVSDIQYQEHSDRLLFQNWEKQDHNYSFHSSTLEDIELYANQPICNP